MLFISISCRAELLNEIDTNLAWNVIKKLTTATSFYCSSCSGLNPSSLTHFGTTISNVTLWLYYTAILCIHRSTIVKLKSEIRSKGSDMQRLANWAAIQKFQFNLVWFFSCCCCLFCVSCCCCCCLSNANANKRHNLHWPQAQNTILIDECGSSEYHSYAACVGVFSLYFICCCLFLCVLAT